MTDIYLTIKKTNIIYIYIYYISTETTLIFFKLHKNIRCFVSQKINILRKINKVIKREV